VFCQEIELKNHHRRQEIFKNAKTLGLAGTSSAKPLKMPAK
jgi:hypothetical protein